MVEFDRFFCHFVLHVESCSVIFLRRRKRGRCAGPSKTGWAKQKTRRCTRLPEFSGMDSRLEKAPRLEKRFFRMPRTNTANAKDAFGADSGRKRETKISDSSSVPLVKLH
jgi:hypothetical protein